MSLKQPAPDSPQTPSNSTQKVLTLCDSAAVRFGVSRTHIDNIMSNQEDIQKMYTDGSDAQTKYLSCKQLQ